MAKIIIYLYLFLVMLPLNAMERDGIFRFSSHRQSEKIAVRIAHNLVIVPLQINDSPPMNFILDTGVRTSLITEPALAYMLDLDIHEMVFIMGLGHEGVVEAFRSKYNTIRLGSIKGEDMDLIVLPDGVISFMEVFGFPVYGIIGYDFLKTFPVYVNYIQEYIRVYREPTYPIRRNSIIIPFELIEGKPYTKASITGKDQEIIHARLLIDLGASQALYLNKDYKYMSNHTIPSFLGKGISGNLMGDKGRVQSLELGEQVYLHEPIVSYPDQDFHTVLRDEVLWTGIIGGGVLRRFHVTIDYRNERMVLSKNMHYGERFNSNLSGLEVNVSGKALNEFEIHYVRPNSIAYEKGIQAGDVIQSVDGRRSGFDLMGLEEALSGKPGQLIHLTVLRNGNTIRTRFRLREDL
jgi:hypothetical protein